MRVVHTPTILSSVEATLGIPFEGVPPGVPLGFVDLGVALNRLQLVASNVASLTIGPMSIYALDHASLTTVCRFRNLESLEITVQYPAIPGDRGRGPPSAILDLSDNALPHLKALRLDGVHLSLNHPIFSRLSYLYLSNYGREHVSTRTTLNAFLAAVAKWTLLTKLELRHCFAMIGPRISVQGSMCFPRLTQLVVYDHVDHIERLLHYLPVSTITNVRLISDYRLLEAVSSQDLSKAFRCMLPAHRPRLLEKVVELEVVVTQFLAQIVGKSDSTTIILESDTDLSRQYHRDRFFKAAIKAVPQLPLGTAANVKAICFEGPVDAIDDVDWATALSPFHRLERLKVRDLSRKADAELMGCDGRQLLRALGGTVTDSNPRIPICSMLRAFSLENMLYASCTMDVLLDWIKMRNSMGARLTSLSLSLTSDEDTLRDHAEQERISSYKETFKRLVEEVRVTIWRIQTKDS